MDGEEDDDDEEDGVEDEEEEVGLDYLQKEDIDVRLIANTHKYPISVPTCILGMFPNIVVHLD